MQNWRRFLLIVGLAVSLCGCTDNTESDVKTTETPVLKIESDILGLADTGNKTSLKKDLIYTSGPGDINLYHYNEAGERVIYENQEELQIALEPVQYTGQAVLSLGDVDDQLIDSTNALVRLVDGNGYYTDEFILNADSLEGTWTNGSLVYTLDEGDLEFNTWGYDTTTDYNSDREWSIMGGDGNGVYYFTAEVSGILYDGVEIEPAEFTFAVYVYGRTCTDLALSSEFVENTVDEAYSTNAEPSQEIQWIWHTDNEASLADGRPYLNDCYTDYISIIWPEGTDTSGISEDEVKVTLFSKYGDEYTLSKETDYGEHEVSVITKENETIVAVTYQQWAYIPVYSQMEIVVDNTSLSASKTYDIASVAAYMTQTGGGGVSVDHTVTAYNYYGVMNMDIQNAANTGYTLSTVIDGKTYFYTEDESGKASLTEGIEEISPWGAVSVIAPMNAWKGDATEKYNIAVLGNVVFAETRLDTIEEKEVEGVLYTFTQNVNVTKDISQIIADGARFDDGYNYSGSGVDKWAWTMRYQSGWTTTTNEPSKLPYVEGHYGYGYEPGEENPLYTIEFETQAAQPKMGMK